jgi:hypothetical protein
MTKIQKYVLTCILALITSLLKLRELDKYFKKSQKKSFCFLLVSGIMNLIIHKRIPNIKKVILFIDVRMVRFYMIS